MKNKYFLYTYEIIILIVGCFISAFAINQLLIPSQLLSAGLTGIAMIINVFTKWDVGILYLIFNIPLLVLGYKHLGRKFSVYTILGVVIVSLFLQIIPVKAVWTSDPLLSSIFGGIIVAIGGAIVLRVGGSQGGLDILARIVSKYKNISIGKFSLLVNIGIIICSALIFKPELALYTIISIFTGMKTYEIILSHVNRVSVLIVTQNGDEVSEAITKNIYRGVTKWNATGAYSKLEKQVLFCVIVEGQLNDLQKIVKTVDKEAFVTVISTKNVIGTFHQIW